MTLPAAWNTLGVIGAELRAYKLRSGLAMLAIAVAIATVASVAAVIEGLNRFIQSTIDVLGPRTFYVSRLPPIVPYGRFSEEVRRRRFLDWPLREDLRKLCPSIEIATAFATRAFFFGEDLRVSYGGESVEKLILRGVEPEYTAALPAFTVADGRFISDFDEAHGAEVAVIGTSVARSLFPHRDPVGKIVRLNGSAVQVIGVFEQNSGVLSAAGADDFVVIPLSLFRKRFPESKEIVIACTVRRGSQEEQAKDEVTGALRRSRHVPPGAPCDFDIVSPRFIRSLWNSLTQALVALTAAISCVGLGVGGIGVMNVMLISVRERTAEIGIRRAVGACRSDIRFQFLLEAVAVTLFGGICGVFCGAAFVWTLRSVFPTLPALLSLHWAVISVVSSIVVGLVFGYFPASRAANLSPTECLSYEN